ncbi:hypothetical protein AVCANL279_07470 [Campylobacter canadensis]|uniref:hypothetical protein n=1 Tax=Campylobacter canadensis TaxID=449520 RepID=UPI001557A6B4|nr:hypothetical protein [Campylobacter canadensis]MBZ7995146.1 hypothetical protein [Campylobacter canadensis]MBZ7997158.1 hypothetical protein [Campylobacter canadensis]MBZ8000854.1 hypothetical protein [Campylobacter canadensis]MBZ8003822.1 hypothetical protein [Campylobacter canadensis]
MQKSDYIRLSEKINNAEKLLMLEAFYQIGSKKKTFDFAYIEKLIGVKKISTLKYLKHLENLEFVEKVNSSESDVSFYLIQKHDLTLEKIKETANFSFELFLDFIDYKKRLLKKHNKKRAFEDTQFVKTAKALNDLKDYDLANATMELTMERGWLGLFPEQAKKQLMQKRRAANFNNLQNISISELIKAPDNTIVKDGVKYTAILTANGWEISKCVAS